MQGNRIEIGIDVGWSKRNRSCGVALRGITPAWDGRYVTNYGDIALKLFRLDELVNWLPGFIERLGDDLHRTTLVVDGPLGLHGPPQVNRHVDGASRIQGFYGRAFPNDVTGNSGQTYVNTTYHIVNPFLNVGNTIPWLGDRDLNGLTVTETHPTVGLAMLLPMFDPATLPSRNRPLCDGAGGDRLIRAKSDWYWTRDGGHKVARLLVTPNISDESHHERRAALFCLAVAKCLSCNQAIAMGRADGVDNGVYVLPACLHENWRDEVIRVGVTQGTPNFVQ